MSGPKLDYKLAWFDRFHKHDKKLLGLQKPVILARDYSVIPTELDVYEPSSWINDALFFPESHAAYQKLVAQGWTDSIRELYPTEKIYTFWDYFRNAYARNAGLRIDHLLLSPQLRGRLVAAGVDRDVWGWEKSSDHAPTWDELKDVPKNRKLAAGHERLVALSRLGLVGKGVEIDRRPTEDELTRLIVYFNHKP